MLYKLLQTSPSRVFLYFFIVVMLLFAFAMNFGTTAFQQYVSLSEAFLQGKLHFLRMPASPEDTILFQGNYYWPLGPFPAVLLMPFVFFFQLFHITFYQGFLQFFITTGVFYLCYAFARRYRYSHEDALYLACAFCFASVYQIAAFVPWVWFFSQAITVLLLFLALQDFHTKRCYFIIGLLYAAVFATRFTAGLSIVFFLAYIMFEKKDVRSKMKYLYHLLLPVCICGILLLTYNYFRFGSIFDNGYIGANNFLLSEKDRYEVLHHGLFKFSNIPTNIYYYFIKTLDPVLIPVKTIWGNTYILQLPYVTVQYPGTSFFVSSPIFLYLFRNKLKTAVSKYALVAVLTVLFVLLLYYWPGWRQVGPRYLLDLLPFAYLLLLESFRGRRVPTFTKIIIYISAFYNLYFLGQVLRF